MFPLFLVILFIWSYAQAAYERGGQEMVSSNVKTMTNNSTKLTPQRLPSFIHIKRISELSKGYENIFYDT